MSERVNSSLKTAVKGTTIVLAGSVVSLLLWFSSKVLIVRSTTKEEFGIYSLAVAVVSVLAMLAAMGLPEGVARFVSIRLGEGNRGEADSVSVTALRISFVSGIGFYIVLFLFSSPVSKHIFYMPQLAPALRVISVFLPLTILSNIIGSILRGHNIIGPKVLFLDVGQPLSLLLFLGAFLLLGLPFISILYAFTLSMAAVLLFMGIYTFKRLGLNPFSASLGRAKDLLKFALPLLFSGLAGLVMMWTDTLMVGRYLDAVNVGVYNVSVTLVRLLIVPLSAITFVFMPLAGAMYAKEQHSELNRTYQVLTKWTFFATLPIFFVLFFFPEMTITTLFGERFVTSSPSLRILSLGFLFHTFLGVNSMLLIVMGMSRAIMNISFFAAFLNIVLNYVLIKHLGMGIEGAALATAISYVALNVVTSAVVYKQSRMHPLTAKYLRPVVGSAGVGLLVYLLAKSLPLHLWMMPLYLVLFILCYLLSLILTRSIEKEDIALFDAVRERTGIHMDFIRKFLIKAEHSEPS
jgi:O-antigen/teichoic acid export membrane protein